MKQLKELEKERARAFSQPLLAWYKKHKRSLPWRGHPSAYAVWVSEVMLQQTRVEVVRDYFSRWLERLPTLESLAQSSEDDVLHLWQGLGYYSRARRLRSGAQYVMQNHGGELPDSVPELLKVPGIGPYTAGAVASIAFNKRVPLVDGNVIRVLTRYFALPGDPTAAPLLRTLWSYADQLVPAKNPGDFNQALMELGATVCTPRSPLCHSCPVSQSCLAFSQGAASKFPQLKPKQKPQERSFVVLVLRKKGKYATIRLPSDATWWAGLDAFPFKECNASQIEQSAVELAAEICAGRVVPRQTLPPIRHSVTRYKLSLTPVICDVSGRDLSGATVRWVTLSEVSELAFPSVFAKVVKAIEFEQKMS